MAKNVVLIGTTGFVGNAILNELVSEVTKLRLSYATWTV